VLIDRSTAIGRMLRESRRSVTAIAAAILATLFLAGAALAQSDVITVVVADSITHDSNLFRRPDSLNPQSDRINSASVGLRIDKQYAQQRFQLEASQTSRRYDKLSRLNSDAVDYNAAWLWFLTPRWSGTLSTSRSESLVPFEDTLGTQRNVRISQNRAFTADGLLFGGWHLLLGITQADQTSEQAVQIEPDFRATSAEAGIRYVAPSGNSVSAVRRATKGDYLNQPAVPGLVDNGYQVDDSELKANWAITGKSSLTGGVAWRERTNKNPAQRDFSGLDANLSYSWRPTGKLALSVLASQTLTPLQNSPSAYVVNDTLSIGPTWQASPKVAVRLSLSRAESNYRGTGVVPAAGPARRDTLDSAEVGVNWSVMRSASVGISVQQQRRASNTDGIGFDATLVVINASITF